MVLSLSSVDQGLGFPDCECPTRRRVGEERGDGSGSGGSLNSRVPLAAGPFGEVNQLLYYLRAVTKH